MKKLIGLLSLFMLLCASVVLAATEDTITVNFQPNYPPAQPQEDTILVNFQPNYPPPLPTEDTITVNFQPNYPYNTESPNGTVSMTYYSAMLSGEPVQAYINIEPIETPRATVALAEAGSLNLVSELYDIGPDNTIFSPPASMVFKYTEPLPDGISEEDLNVYRYDDPGEGWQIVNEGIVRNTEENWIQVDVASLCLFGVFAAKPDTTPPQSDFHIAYSSYQVIESSITYVNSRISFILSAIDPVCDGTASGVKQVMYRVDAGDTVTLASANNILDLSQITDGLHMISYWACDNFNNVEAAKEYTAYFDGSKPEVLNTYPGENTWVRAKDLSEIKIVFSEPINCLDWYRAVVVHECKNRKIKGYSINYDPGSRTLFIKGKFKNNTGYTVTISGEITDKVYNKFDDYSFSFSTVMNAKEGGTFEDEDTGLILVVPPCCLPCDGYFEANIVEQTNQPRLPYPLQWLLGQRKAYLIIFRDTNGRIVKEKIERAFKLILVLRNRWIAFAPSAQDKNTSLNLRLFQVGTEDDAVALMEQKEKSPSLTQPRSFSPVLLASKNVQNIDEQQISTDIYSCGLFNVAGFMAPSISLEDLSCYPNPFNPMHQGLTIQYYLMQDNDVSIAVYDLLGNLVKTWKFVSGDTNAKTGLNQLVWDGRNGEGNMAANGGYIVSIIADGQKKKFKVLVVK